MMPACDHTGTPRHFHSSITSGSAALMSARTFASTSPRQSPRSVMRASIRRVADAPPFPSCAALFLMAVLPNLAEAGPQFLDKEVRLLEGGEMAAAIELVPVDNILEEPFRPAPRRYENLLWEN